MILTCSMYVSSFDFLLYQIGIFAWVLEKKTWFAKRSIVEYWLEHYTGIRFHANTRQLRYVWDPSLLNIVFTVDFVLNRLILMKHTINRMIESIYFLRRISVSKSTLILPHVWQTVFSFINTTESNKHVHSAYSSRHLDSNVNFFQLNSTSGKMLLIWWKKAKLEWLRDDVPFTYSIIVLRFFSNKSLAIMYFFLLNLF
jgi:hypothetical protein